MNSSPRNSAAHCSRADRMSVDACACSGGGDSASDSVSDGISRACIHIHTRPLTAPTTNTHVCARAHARARIYSQARTCAGRAPDRCPHAHMCECIAHARTIVRVRRGQVLAASTNARRRTFTHHAVLRRHQPTNHRSSFLELGSEFRKRNLLTHRRCGVARLHARLPLELGNPRLSQLLDDLSMGF
jgi:hypothetical protein